MIGIGIRIGIIKTSKPVLVVVATSATGIGETSFTANWNPYSGAQYYLLDVSTSSSFSSFILQNQVVSTNSYLVTGLTANTTYYYRVRASTDPDPDAAAFFARVSTAGGTLTTTEKNAVNQLVLDLKANSLWTPMKAIYPMVGASAAACAQNLKSSSFTGTFTSGWTFANTGVTGNGTSAYMNTNFNTNINLQVNNLSISLYTSTDGAINNQILFGNSANNTTYLPIIQFYPRLSGNLAVDLVDFNYRIIVNNPTTKGFYINTKTAENLVKIYKNNNIFGISTSLQSQTILPNNNIPLGAFYDSISYNNFSNYQISFFQIGEGLTDTQASNFYTAVQAFQTTLGRQV